jgi:hypothetical protein
MCVIPAVRNFIGTNDTSATVFAFRFPLDDVSTNYFLRFVVLRP